MKKQIKKLNLSKQTISNLAASEMSRRIGGAQTNGGGCDTVNGPPFTKKCRPSW
jgi:natural product precursor